MDWSGEAEALSELLTHPRTEVMKRDWNKEGFRGKKKKTRVREKRRHL